MTKELFISELVEACNILPDGEFIFVESDFAHKTKKDCERELKEIRSKVDQMRDKLDSLEDKVEDIE